MCSITIPPTEGVGLVSDERCSASTFEEMPYDVIRAIVSHVDAEERFHLLLTCKAIAFVAGEMLCDGRMAAFRGQYGIRTEKDRAYDIHQMLAGLENKAPTREKPFGRDLKLRYLRFVKYLNLENYGQMPFDEAAMLKMTKAMKELRAEGIEPFPNLKTVELGGSPPSFSIAAVVHRHFDTAFTSVIRAETLTIKSGYSFKELSNFESKYRCLKFAEGHMPREVLHQPGDIKCIPMVCHGTVNKVIVPSFVSKTIEDSVRYVSHILQHAHPEVNAKDAKPESDDEWEKREKTRWIYSWEMVRMNGIHWHHGQVTKVREMISQEFPAMSERLSFLPRGPETGGWAQLISRK